MQSKSERLAQDLRDPKELTTQEIAERFAARDKHPDLYLQAKQREAALKREAVEREDARAAWLRSGGDPKAFDREWETISTEAKRIQMLQEQKAAREDAWRYAREGF